MARVSSIDRNRRFVVTQASKKRDGARGYDVFILGEGASYAEAVDRASHSDLGMAAEREHAQAILMMKAASESATPEEFADRVMRDTLSEAEAAGASTEAIEALKEKFTEARKHINDDSSQPPVGTS